MSTRPTPEEEDQRKGRHNAPLVHIPLTHVVPDELHLVLRITAKNVTTTAYQRRFPGRLDLLANQ